MSCIVIDIGLANINVIKKLGVFVDGIVQGYSFCPPRKYKPTKQAVWCTKNLHGSVWNSGPSSYSELPNIFPSKEYFAEGIEKCKTFGNFLGKEVENLEDHDCRKVQDLVDEEAWICSSYQFPHKITLRSAERREKLFSNWILQHLKL